MPKQSHEVQRTYVWKLSTSMLSDFAHCVDLYVSGSRSSHGSHSTDIGPHHEACAMHQEGLFVAAKRQFSNTTLSFRYDLFTIVEAQDVRATPARSSASPIDHVSGSRARIETSFSEKKLDS